MPMKGAPAEPPPASRFQYVAGRGAFDEHRARHDVRTVPVEIARGPGVVGGDVDGVLEHIAFGHALGSEVLHRIAALVFQNAFVGHRVDGHGLTAAHRHHRRRMHIGDIPPQHLIRQRLQVVVSADVSLTGLQDGETLGPAGGGRRGRAGAGTPGPAGRRHRRTRSDCCDNADEISPTDPVEQSSCCTAGEFVHRTSVSSVRPKLPMRCCDGIAPGKTGSSAGPSGEGVVGEVDLGVRIAHRGHQTRAEGTVPIEQGGCAHRNAVGSPVRIGLQSDPVIHG